MIYASIIPEAITSVFVINYISTWRYLINQKFQLRGQEASQSTKHTVFEQTSAAQKAPVCSQKMLTNHCKSHRWDSGPAEVGAALQPKQQSARLSLENNTRLRNDGTSFWTGRKALTQTPAVR